MMLKALEGLWPVALALSLSALQKIHKLIFGPVSKVVVGIGELIEVQIAPHVSGPTIPSIFLSCLSC